MSADTVAYALANFNITMFFFALCFILLNRIVTQGRVSQFEILYRWVVFFAVGCTGVYTFVMHVFFPEVSASNIGWPVSPFQYEVGVADLGFGIIAILAFNASYGFRLSATMGNAIWLWGDALGHIIQMFNQHNVAPGNAGTWFWTDVLLPVILIAALAKLPKPVR